MSVAEHTCRTCGKMSEQGDGSDLCPMFTSTEYHNELKMVLEEFEIWNLNIAQGDGLPQKICLTCFDSFCQIHNFRMICQEAQTNFGELCVGLDIIIKLEAQYDDADVDPDDFEGEQTITVQEHYQFPAGETQNVPDKHAGSKTCGKLLENLNSDDESTEENGEQNAIEKVNENICDVKPYQCEYCMDVVSFDDPELLNQHYNTLHSSDLPYQCPKCEKSFDTKIKRNGHARIHFRETIDCETCGRKVRKQMMDRHNELHHILKERECTICGKKFDNITLKRFHYHESWHDETKLHKCKYCQKKFIQVTQLVIHERTHTGANPFLCTECGVGFTTSGLLEDHIKLHGVKDLQCPHCPKSFAQQQNLKNHMQIHDPDKKGSCCLICAKYFRSTMNLRLHNHRSHGAPASTAILNILRKREKYTIIKPFKCNKCPESFVLHSLLDKHMKTHNEIRPYSCDLCSKTFKRDSHLKLHINSLHLNNKPHKCSICGWAFPQKSNLREHIAAKHEYKKDFKCDICEKSFAIAKTLKIHKLKHLEKKPYTCTVCNKSFRLHNTLKTHINSHWRKIEAKAATVAKDVSV